MALIVVAAWGEQTWVGRRLFGEALLLWVNREHRLHLLGRSDEPKRPPRSAGAINQMIGRAVLKGWMDEPRVVHGHQSLRLKLSPSPVGLMTPTERKRIDEIREVVEVIRTTREGIIQVTEDSIDATKEFVQN